MRNFAVAEDKRLSPCVFSFQDNASLHIERLKRLTSLECFTENDIKRVIGEIQALSRYKDSAATRAIEGLVDFKREVEWYSHENGIRYPIGIKEIGYDIRFESIKALGKIGDRNSLQKLRIALEDQGDMDKEYFENRWYVYCPGDEIQQLATEVINKLLSNN